MEIVMKIFIVYPGGDALGGGGVERRFSRLIQHFQSVKPELEIYFLVTRPFKEWILNNFPFLDPKRIIAPSIERNRFHYCIWSMKMVLMHRPEIVHFLTAQLRVLPIVIFSKLCASKVITCVIDSRHASPLTKIWQIPYYAWIEWAFSDKLDLLYPSFLETIWGKFFEKKVIIAPCSFTDYKSFCFNSSSDSKKPHILFCGRLIEEKNPMLFLKAISKLKFVLIDKCWQVIIVGGGPLKKEIDIFIRANHLDNIVTLMITNNTPPLFKEASIFVSLQKTENYPSQALLEAMGAKCCIIATDVGNTKLLIDNKTGMLLNDGNIDLLKDHLEFCIKNPETRERKGENAYVRAIKEHTIEKYAEHTYKLWINLKKKNMN
ncbi:glycosyltransferase family 4 protein [Aminivibrio sp.]|uniref:glycosyltransferase family 4 protein n=1 Tax=Aminivibrio sp. TaxID=1872489 RepID=UPI003D995F58